MQLLSRRAVLSTVASLVVLAFGYLVWPTPYRYTTWTSGDATWPVRISRLTGRADLLTRIGWLPMAPAPDPLGKIEKKLGIQ